MEEYKPNSHRSKEERKESIPEKHVEKVISGTVKPKKKSEMQKFADVFISEDVNNVKWMECKTAGSERRGRRAETLYPGGSQL